MTHDTTDPMAQMRSLIREGCDFLSVEADALKDSISINGEVRADPEDTPAIEAINEWEDWISRAGAALALPLPAPAQEVARLVAYHRNEARFIGEACAVGDMDTAAHGVVSLATADLLTSLAAENERLKAQLREAAMQSLADAGQAQDAYVAQLKAEAERDALTVAQATVAGGLAEALAQLAQAKADTHQHVKRGTLYRHIGTARIQSDVPLNDMERVEVYIGHGEDDLWVRRQAEFHDGRFTTLLQPRADGGEG